ncbi:hypothetical protein C8J56DRAFT_889938 [Mycena floridula]|nr:hypothetical protein C8J56DRAFT_889938 [Mycena floridula]
MRFSIASLFMATVIFPVLAMAHNAQPSGVPSSGWHCPQSDNNSQSWIDWLSDRPPHHKKLQFGCTYRTGHGSGTYVCSYDSKSGECTGGGQHCPSYANHSAKKAPRSTEPAPPTPGGHIARRQFHQKKSVVSAILLYP